MAALYLRAIEGNIQNDPFFQSEVENTEKKWVFLLTIILKTLY